MKRNLTWTAALLLLVSAVILVTHRVAHQPTVFAQAGFPIAELFADPIVSLPPGALRK